MYKALCAYKMCRSHTVRTTDSMTEWTQYDKSINFLFRLNFFFFAFVATEFTSLVTNAIGSFKESSITQKIVRETARKKREETNDTKLFFVHKRCDSGGKKTFGKICCLSIYILQSTLSTECCSLNTKYSWIHILLHWRDAALPDYSTSDEIFCKKLFFSLQILIFVRNFYLNIFLAPFS